MAQYCAEPLPDIPEESSSNAHCQRNKENVLPCFNTKVEKIQSTIVPQLEYLYKTSDLNELCLMLSVKFFEGRLANTEVVWSSRMTLRAGLCRYIPSKRACLISLSEPLLKLRSKKDLIDILLHEMIHAFLFVTKEKNPYHGHPFKLHMNRINKEAGTNITLYHPFVNEIQQLRKHWWRCNGPCQKEWPSYGYVKRTIDRAPGPSEKWWRDHLFRCTGRFIKIKGPENHSSKNSKGKKGKTTTSTKEI